MAMLRSLSGGIQEVQKASDIVEALVKKAV